MNGQRVQLFTYAVYNTCKYVRSMNKIADWNSSIRPRHYSYPLGYSFIRYFEDFIFHDSRRICARLESRLHFLFQCHTLELCDHHRPHTYCRYNREKIVRRYFFFRLSSHKPNDKRHYERHTHTPSTTAESTPCPFVCRRLRLSVVASYNHWTCSYSIHWIRIILIIIPWTFLR